MKIFNSIFEKWLPLTGWKGPGPRRGGPHRGLPAHPAGLLDPPIGPAGLREVLSNRLARAISRKCPFNERGISSIAAALTLLILAAFGGVLTYMVAAGSVSRMHHVSQVQAFYVTQAGIEYAVKRVYEGLNEIVNPPGINFADGSFTISRSGRTLTVTGTVGDAIRVHSVDSPTEADCTLIDTSNVNLGANDTRIQQIQFRKICLVTVTISQMQFSWAPDGGERLTEIRIESSTVYTNPTGATSGTLLETADYVLSNPNTNVMNRVQFDSQINSKTVTLSFIMGDNTVKTVTFETED